MTKKVLHTQGTTFSRGAGTPLVFTAVAQITNAAPPGWKRKALDVTTLDQTGDAMEKVGAVLIENEAIDLELLLDPGSTTISTLESDKNLTDPVAYRITLRNGEHFDFLGVIVSWKYEGKMNDLLKVKASIDISGLVTKTPGA